MSRVKGRLEEFIDDCLLIFEYLFETGDKECYRYTNGLRYKLTLVLVCPEKDKRLLLYDNFHCSHPHVHVGAERISYSFNGIRNLLMDFASEALTLGFDLQDWMEFVEVEISNSSLNLFL